MPQAAGTSWDTCTCTHRKHTYAYKHTYMIHNAHTPKNSRSNPCLMCCGGCILVPHFILCGFAISLQLLMIFWLSDVVENRAGKCPTDFAVQLAGLFLFNIKVVEDLMGSWDMTRWCNNPPF